MDDLGYLWFVMLVMALATFLTRVLPFIALNNHHDHPFLIYLGRYMPPVIMTILVIYSLKNVEILVYPYGVKSFSAVGMTAIAHLLWHNALLSIFCGTALYVLLVQGM